MSLADVAYNTIPQSNGHTEWHTKSGNTNDIIAVILEADKDETTTAQTQAFTIQLRKQSSDDYDILRKLWRFVRQEITYRVDPPGQQFIKSPARTWSDRYGDCKSMTLFITSVLRNLGIDYKIRFAAYERLGKFKHVYPVAILNGKEVIIDAVHYQFNEEVRYKKKKDVMTEIARLSGVNGVLPYVKRIKRYIPMATSTDGEIYIHLIRRQLQILSLKAISDKQRSILQKGMDVIDSALVTGIHNPGGRIITGSLPKELEYVGTVLNNAASRGRSAMDFVPKNGIGNPYAPSQAQIDACGVEVAANLNYTNPQTGATCVPGGNPTAGVYLNDPTCRPNLVEADEMFAACRTKKFYENLINDHFEDASPALLYNFIADENDVPNIKTSALFKRARQNEYVGGIQYLTGISSGNIKLMMRNGILANGDAEQPESLLDGLNSLTQTNYDDISAGAAIAAISAIIVAVVAAVVSITEIIVNAKNQDPYGASQANWDNYNLDPEFLKNNLGPQKMDWNVLQSNGGNNGGSGNGNGGSGSNSSNLLLPAFVLGGIYLYNKKR